MQGGRLAFLIKSPVIFEEPALPDDILVDIRNLHFTYGDRPVLEGINMTIPRGKVVAIMGGSGCGKTTLLRCIGGQLRPSGGSVRFGEHQVCRMSHAELYRLRRGMGMLFQFGALFTDMTVFENVAFPLREHTDLSDEMIRDLVLMKLEAVGLRGAHALMPGELSGGMARRVALARAVALYRSRPDRARRHRPVDPQAERRPGGNLDHGHPRHPGIVAHRRLHLLP
jgi:phospholipid/cholesterol/gamma-HCH transport system ATP-binding protein